MISHQTKHGVWYTKTYLSIFILLKPLFQAVTFSNFF